MLAAIGSFALPAECGKRFKDLDVVATRDERPRFLDWEAVLESPSKATYRRDGLTCEVEWAGPRSSADLLLRSSVGGEERRAPVLGKIPVVAPEALRAVYGSTCLFPVQWHKNFAKYELLRKAGYGEDREIFELRALETAARRGYSGKRYDQPNKAFFKSSVAREIPHDELHLLLKWHDRPLFERIERDLSRTGISLEMFEELPFEERLRSVWEEALVLGHERFRTSGTSCQNAAWKALAGLCNNWYPLEFRPFVLRNMGELLARFPYEMWSALDQARSGQGASRAASDVRARGGDDE